MITVAPLRPEDRLAWGELARGYKDFYRTPTTEAEYEAVWRQLRDESSGFCCLGAYDSGELVGIVHFLFHAVLWTGEACFLQDLFTAEAARGQGAGRALIAAVAEAARERGATRLYWHTQEGNAPARLLYDKVARFSGFIRYEYPL